MSIAISRRDVLFGAAQLALAGAILRGANAQSSSQAIRIIYPFAAGGAGDALARILADRIGAGLSRPVIVENRTGGAGRLGTKAVIAAEPDGATLLLAPNPVISIYPYSYAALDYDPNKDLAPISLVSTFEMALVVAPHLEMRTIDDLIRWIKANPEKANCGSSGAGGLSHFFSEMFASAIGVKFNHVHYRGTALVLNDIVGGQIPFAFVLVGDVQELHSANRVRVLGISGTQPSPLLPGVKTFKELNIAINGQGWYGLYAPAKTSPDMVEKLNKATTTAFSTDDVKNRIIKLGLVPQTSTPGELAAYQRRDGSLWENVVKASGFKPQ